MAKVLFVQDVLFESFGPECLCAALKARGHACDLWVLASTGRRGFLRRLRAYRPDILAFSISSFGFRWALDAAREAKRELPLVTVFGGPHPTFFREFALEEGVDYACVGEGEGALVDLAEALDRGGDPAGIANLARRTGDGGLVLNPLRPLVADLDALPDPDRGVYFQYAPLRDLSYKRFMVSRGCPYNCTYCFNKAAKGLYAGLGPYVRRRSPERVVEEILRVRSRYGIRTAGFIDDTFTTDKRWLTAFLDLYRREVSLPFTCVVRINEIDEEAAEALGRAGCTYASFGLEVGNERLRNTLLGRQMSDGEIRAKSALLHKAGVKFLTYNMFGVPGETLEDGLSTVRLNAEIGTDLVGASVFQPLLGTEIHRTCVREGYLDPEFPLDALDRMTARSPFRNMPDLRALENLQKLAFIGVAFPRLIPLLGRLARLPLRPLYALLYKGSLFLRFKVRFGLSTLETLRLGMGSKGRFG